MLAVVPSGTGYGLADETRCWTGPADDVAARTDRLVLWGAATSRLLPLRPRAVWDLAAVHKVLHGGRRDDPAGVWAAAHDLPEPPRPVEGLTLLDASLAVVEEYAGPVRADGSLHPDAER
ncbi:MAG: hypothetical protein ACXVGH_14255, partial [Mycobacteriales bacterium]